MSCLKKSIFLILFLFYVVSCTYHVDINPNISPTTSISKKLNLAIGLYIPSDIKGLDDEDSASWDEKYVFNIGEALYNIIFKAIGMTFQRVMVLESYPTAVMIKDRKLDGFIAVRLNESNFDLHKEEGFLRDQAKGNVHLSVDISFFDTEMILVTSFTCIGTSTGSRTYDFLYFHGKGKYKPIVESAIRNLGNNIVQMVYGSYDIRKLAEGK